jgi:hypothetical protein
MRRNGPCLVLSAGPRRARLRPDGDTGKGGGAYAEVVARSGRTISSTLKPSASDLALAMA